MGRGGARVLVLLAWAGFFAWLWVTGETSRYLGARTSWVVPFGAVVVGLASLAQAFFLVRRRGEGPEPLSRPEATGAILMLAPLLAVALVPRAELGSFALSRKLVNRQAPSVASTQAGGQPAQGADAKPAKATGEIGFVSHLPSTPPGMFELTRFQIACCVADAVPVSFTVDPGRLPADYPSETWLKVSGTWSRSGERIVLAADRIERVKRPNNPYIGGR